MTNPTPPPKTLKTIPADRLDGMTPAEIMALPPEAIVNALGGASCDIRTLNVAKKIENDAVVGKWMPQLVVTDSNGKPSWNPKIDLDRDGVEHHEVLARLIRASQIAKASGISLGEVKLDDMKCKDLQEIGAKLIGKAPQVCTPGSSVIR